VEPDVDAVMGCWRNIASLHHLRLERALTRFQRSSSRVEDLAEASRSWGDTRTYTYTYTHTRTYT
jgi:hypothetical protein